jgi:hypothetical protein
MGFSASSQTSFRIKVEERREACIKSFEGGMWGGRHEFSKTLKVSRRHASKTLKRGGGGMHLTRIEGRRRRHASS